MLNVIDLYFSLLTIIYIIICKFTKSKKLKTHEIHAFVDIKLWVRAWLPHLWLLNTDLKHSLGIYAVWQDKYLRHAHQHPHEHESTSRVSGSQGRQDGEQGCQKDTSTIDDAAPKPVREAATQIVGEQVTIEEAAKH